MNKAERHRAREAALQILYQHEFARCEVAQAVDTFFGLQWPDADPAPGDLRTFAAELAHETVRQLPAIDPLIADTAERWRPERMAVLDRLILRMAVCELVRDPETPPAVVINEALELAKRFSGDEATGFVNGVLDAVRKQLQNQSEDP